MKTVAALLAAVSLCTTFGPSRAKAQTKSTDAVPTFKLEYFVGTWAFDWTRPETPLGPAGDIVGTEMSQLVAPTAVLAPAAGLPAFPRELLPAGVDRVLESRTEGRGPAGPFKTRAVLIYDVATKHAMRHEIDEAGHVATFKGSITGDLGGIYTFTWESTAQRDGRTIYLKGRRTAYSPHNFRDFLQYSLDGKRFVSFGQPWFRKRASS